MKSVHELLSSPLPELLSLNGQTAVVTGGAGRIGWAIAKRLHEAGARVIIGDVDGNAAEAVAKEMGPKGTAVIGLALDVSDTLSIRSVIDETIRQFGRLDIWVNNAAARQEQTILETTDEDLDAVLDVNLRGVFISSREAAKHMTKAEGGVIINITSVAAYKAGNGDQPATYITSKNGLIGLTKSLAVELGPRGIRSVAIAPTFTQTTEEIEQTDAPSAAYAAELPLRRVGDPDDVARVVVFAASDLAAFVSGSTIAVDGGDLAR